MSSWPLLHDSQNSSLDCTKASLRQGISQLALLLDSFHLLFRRAICSLHSVPKSPSSRTSNPALEGHHLAFLMISALDVVRALSRVHQSNSLSNSPFPTPSSTRSRKRSRSSESGSSSTVTVGVCYAARGAAELLCQCVELLGRRVRTDRIPPSTSSATALTAASTSTSNASPSLQRLQPQNAQARGATRSRSRPGASRPAAVRRPFYSLAHRRECLLAALECAQLLVDLFSAALRPPAFTRLLQLQQASKHSSKRKLATATRESEQSSEDGPPEESAAGVAVGERERERESESENEAAQTVLLQAVFAAEALAVALTGLVHAHKPILLVHMDHVLVHLLRGSYHNSRV